MEKLQERVDIQNATQNIEFDIAWFFKEVSTPVKSSG
jgi:hypothetical protein